MSVISQDDFFKCLFDINPDGDPHMAFESLNLVLGQEDTTMEGTPITFKLICDSYKTYCDLWDAKWEGTESRFIPKNESKKTIWEFLNLKMYKRKFENAKTGRDDYFFGSTKIASLNEQLKEFLKESQINHL